MNTPQSETFVGEIEFYPITHYLTGYELSYLVFGPTTADGATPQRR